MKALEGHKLKTESSKAFGVSAAGGNFLPEWISLYNYTVDHVKHIKLVHRAPLHSFQQHVNNSKSTAELARV